MTLKCDFLRYYEESRKTHREKVAQHNEGYPNMLLYPWYHVVQIFHILFIGAGPRVFIVKFD